MTAPMVGPCGAGCDRDVDLADPAVTLDVARSLISGEWVIFGICPTCLPTARLHCPPGMTPPCCAEVGGECEEHRYIRTARERARGTSEGSA